MSDVLFLVVALFLMWAVDIASDIFQGQITIYTSSCSANKNKDCSMKERLYMKQYYKIFPQSQIVVSTFGSGKKTFGPIKYKECTVINRRNFVCYREDKSRDWNVKIRNGKYIPRNEDDNTEQVNRFSYYLYSYGSF